MLGEHLLVDNKPEGFTRGVYTFEKFKINEFSPPNRLTDNHTLCNDMNAQIVFSSIKDLSNCLASSSTLQI